VVKQEWGLEEEEVQAMSAEEFHLAEIANWVMWDIGDDLNIEEMHSYA
jgi:hypothetical protein